MKHLKNNIGYLLAIVGLAIYFDTPDDDYPLWLWWLIVPLYCGRYLLILRDWFWDKWAKTDVDI